MTQRPKRNAANKLERWEIALIKRMISAGILNDQDILAYFTRPTRSINHARIAEIRNQAKHRNVAAASQAELGAFLQAWPQIDPVTGAHLRGDELLVKAREAMLQAVQGFNNPRAYFKSEMFIVIAVIAYTYLLHWHYRRSGVDIRYKRAVDGVETVLKTRHGADKHWELEACIDYAECPLDAPTIANLRFLIAIRHEIEHQLTNQIDDTISAKLQACCLNFNRAIKEIAGAQHGLDRDLSLALQFSGISRDHRNILLSETDMPAHIQAAHTEYEDGLTDEMVADPRYSYRVAYIEQAVNSRGKADQVVEFLRPGTEKGDHVRLALREVEKPKLKPGQIVSLMREEGYPRFNLHHHTQLWQTTDAKAPGKAFGTTLADGAWYWYPAWVDQVRAHVQANGDRYGPGPAG
ncbi:DUF3644 domain-containing protein [Swaminathania salitolerans]|uniref:DUF3644 domain-containing protein n=1 Tax=Swaminathania salitolerans TaxID=182838 RepID=A0A511BN76_9PROT|nr:DUF3644 domain-containing protein [Swaminathania salitolerans]GBQ15855.1 hypothetical protein AA21291_2323 [Swaminathania salitolerans LMG 21291]GEL01512.1 hypothetical protein SSA02_06750 [Swaminathania salitolerans]